MVRAKDLCHLESFGSLVYLLLRAERIKPDCRSGLLWLLHWQLALAWVEAWYRCESDYESQLVRCRCRHPFLVVIAAEACARDLCWDRSSPDQFQRPWRAALHTPIVIALVGKVCPERRLAPWPRQLSGTTLPRLARLPSPYGPQTWTCTQDRCQKSLVCGSPQQLQSCATCRPCRRLR